MNNIRSKDHSSSGSAFIISFENKRTFEIHFHPKLLRKLYDKVNLRNLKQNFIASCGYDQYQIIKIFLNDVGSKVNRPKDFLVNCKVSMGKFNEATPDDFQRMIETLKENASKNPSDMNVMDFFSLDISACFQGDINSTSCFVDASFVHLRHKFKLRPIKPITLAASALLDQLDDVVDPMSGFLTFDAREQLVPMMRSDDKIYRRPLVGVWITGVKDINDTLVWVNLLQYSLSKKLNSTPGQFVLLIFSSNRNLDFFECTPLESDPPPSLLTGHKNILLKEQSTSLSKSLECLQLGKPSEVTKKFQMFMKMFDSNIGSVQRKNYIPHRRKEDDVVDHKDVVPRPMLPSKEREISTITSSPVPEVTLLMDDPQFRRYPQKSTTQRKADQIWTSTPQTLELPDRRHSHNNHPYRSNYVHQTNHPHKTNNQIDNYRSPRGNIDPINDGRLSGEHRNFINNTRKSLEDNSSKPSDRTRNDDTPAHKVTVADRLVASSNKAHQQSNSHFIQGFNEGQIQHRNENKYLNQENYFYQDKYSNLDNYPGCDIQSGGHFSRGFQLRSADHLFHVNPPHQIISPTTTTHHKSPNYQKHTPPQISSSNHLRVSKNITPAIYTHSNSLGRHDTSHKHNNQKIIVGGDWFKTGESHSSSNPVSDGDKSNDVALKSKQFLNSRETGVDNYYKSDTSTNGRHSTANQIRSNTFYPGLNFLDGSNLHEDMPQFMRELELNASVDDTFVEYHLTESDCDMSLYVEDSKRDMKGEKDTNYKQLKEQIEELIGKNSYVGSTNYENDDKENVGGHTFDGLTFLRSEYGCDLNKIKNERSNDVLDNLTVFLSSLDQKLPSTKPQSDKSIYFEKYATKYEDDTRKINVKHRHEPSDASRFYNSYEQKYISDDDGDDYDQTFSQRRYHRRGPR